MTDPATPDAGSSRRRHPSVSLQRRVNRYALLMVTLAVLVTALGGYLATRISVYGAVDAILVSVADKAVAGIGPDPDEAGIRRYVSTNSELPYVVTGVIAADGSVFTPSGSPVLPVDARDVAVAAGQSPARAHTVTTASGASYRIRVVPLGQASGFALVVGRPMAAAQQILTALATALGIFGVLAVVVAVLVGRRLARLGIAPVCELTAEVEQRAAADDLTPVPVGRDDEIGRLATAFNRLLEVVSVSRTRQDRFVADAGHELRTPLTSLRTNIDLLVADSRHPMLRTEDRAAIMTDVHAQLGEFSSLVSDLIGLTREDRDADDFVELDLATVLEQAVDRLSMTGPGFRWTVELEPTTLRGDAELLDRAFANVVHNAMKYSPEGGTITVTLADGVVRISDQGRGIDARERPYVFDRFFRSEASRATPGTGLGLSITQSVVEQHGGTVAVDDAPDGGALLVLSFPSATTSARSPAEVRTG